MVVLSFHTKSQLERLPSGAGWPPLGRPVWGSCHVATDLQTVALIIPWRRLAVGLASVLQLLGRPAGLPWTISASDLAEALLYSWVVSREVGSCNLCDLGLPCEPLDGC